MNKNDIHKQSSVLVGLVKALSKLRKGEREKMCCKTELGEQIKVH